MSRHCPWALLLPLVAALLSLMLETAAGNVIAGKLECPLKSTHVKPGTDLYSILTVSNMTYLLAPGSYTVSDTITLKTLLDHPEAYCIVGCGKEPAAVHLNVTGTTRSPAFRVHAFVSIGLKNLEMDGNGIYSGLHIYGSGRAAVEDVILHHLKGGRLGGAVKMKFNKDPWSGLPGKADFANVQLVDNTATRFGGAVGCTGQGSLSFYNVSHAHLQLHLVVWHLVKRMFYISPHCTTSMVANHLR